MKFFTSIAPKHFHENRQQQCVETWLNHGEVYSINCEKECKELAPLYPNVTFIETDDTYEEKFGKPYVGINAIFKAMKEHGGGVLINSDIEITPDKSKWNRCVTLSQDKNKFLYLHRYNYDTERWRGDIYMDGVDVFFLRPDHLDNLIDTEYCLGHCFFDLYIPFYLFCKSYNICTTRVPVAFHRNHPVQYKIEDWDYFGKYTARKLFFTNQKSAMISNRMYKLIRSHTMTI